MMAAELEAQKNAELAYAENEELGGNVVASMAAREIKEGYERNGKIDQLRQALAGGEFAKLLETAIKAPARDYERNM